MAKMIDITGQKFGMLTVLEKTDKRGADRSIMWKCKCDCGNIVISNGSNLRSGHTKSCGCQKKKALEQYRGVGTTLDLKNKKFGLLTALEPTTQRSSSGYVIWRCLCECGNETFSSSAVLKRGDCCSCGCLKSKGEQIISSLLKINNIKFEKEKTFKDLVNIETKNFYRFDFFVENKYIIEFDGEQHFKAKKYFGGEEYLLQVQKNDKIKNEYCKKHNIPIIRIPYTHLEKLCLEDLLLETSNFIL